MGPRAAAWRHTAACRLLWPLLESGTAKDMEAVEGGTDDAMEVMEGGTEELNEETDMEDVGREGVGVGMASELRSRLDAVLRGAGLGEESGTEAVGRWLAEHLGPATGASRAADTVADVEPSPVAEPGQVPTESMCVGSAWARVVDGGW